MIWFPFYASDFIGATVGLSCQEVSIYNWMLTLYYELGPFPTDRVRVYRIVRCESDEQKRTVDFLLQTFFVLRDDGWYQPRAEQEKVKDAQRHQMAHERGKRSAEVRLTKYGTAQPQSRNAFESLSKWSGNAPELPTPTPTPTPKEKMGRDINVSTSSESVDSDPAEVVVAEKPKTAYRLPDCPYQAIVDAYHDLLPACPRVEVLSDQRKRHLQARWRQVCADEKLDRAAGLAWFRDYFEHVGKSAFLTGKVKPAEGRKPFFASLDWLMSAEKFVHVYEGRYHR